MSDEAKKWRVRFELATGGYTFSDISCKDDLLSRDEVRQWALSKVRSEERYLGIDDIYPVREGE